jgi:uncharacterized surface protein with fasciclin (FAS1) repeats
MPTAKFRILSTSALVGLLAVPLVACSDDDDAASNTTAQETTEAPASETTAMTSESTTADDAAEGTIVDVASANADFSTLVTAIEAAGLAETLSGGEFTVFAPTNEAFAALPPGTLDDLLADPSGALTDVLTYHVVEGAVPAADVVGLDGQEVATVNGAPVMVTVDGETVMVNDASVTATDIEASNGIIHVIDTVLVPPAAS